MMDKKIAFIGPGVMAEAMIAGLLRQKLSKPENLTASGPRLERGGELHEKYGIRGWSTTQLPFPPRMWWCCRSSRSG